MKFKNIRKQYLKTEAVAPFKTKAEDVGSPEVQIARLTFHIDLLTNHMQNNKKDFSSLRGLKKMSSRRKKLLKYLGTNDPARYKTISQKLGLK